MDRYFEGINTAQVHILRELRDFGATERPRGQLTQEIAPYYFEIGNPRCRVCSIPERRVNLKYLAAEFLWYLSGEASVKKIGEHASLWKAIADDKGKVVSNYGRWIYSGEDDSIFLRAARLLVNDPSSRRAIVPIYTAQRAEMNWKDIPCTISLQFLIRDNKLNMITVMRSNDAVFGFTNDIFQFTMMQEMMWALLRPHIPDLELGTYHHFTGSMHLYEKHFQMADAICRSPETNGDPMVEMPLFDCVDHFLNVKTWLVQNFWSERVKSKRITPEEVGADHVTYWTNRLEELNYE